MAPTVRLSIPGGRHALVVVAAAIVRCLPNASESDRCAWQALVPDLQEVHRMAARTSEMQARELLGSTLEVVLRFHASLTVRSRPS